MELKRYLQFVWRWLWLIILCSAAAAAIAWYTTSLQTPLYAATATLLVNQDQGRFAAPSPTFDDLRARERFSQTVVEVLKTRTVLAQALVNLGLQDELSVTALTRRLRTNLVEGTEVFTLEVRDPSRERAVLIANEIVRVFRANERDLLDNPFAQASSLIVVDEPYAQSAPASPNVSRDMLIGAVIGLLLAVVIGYLRDYFDDGMGGGGDMERGLGARPLAEIGVIGGATPSARLITKVAPQSPDAEIYRMFRSHIDSFPAAAPLRTLTVTSPGPRAGKSITAANLAVALAQTGRRVILVDGDLRKPMLHEYFGCPNETGLSNLLAAGDAAGAPALLPTGVANLSLLPAGPASFQAARLFSSPAFAALVVRLQADADLIIFDSSSLLSVVDVGLLAEQTDATLLVARASHFGLPWLRKLLSGGLGGATPSEDLRQALARLQRAEISLLGVLLNDVSDRPRRMRRYYSQQSRERSGAEQEIGRAHV